MTNRICLKLSGITCAIIMIAGCGGVRSTGLLNEPGSRGSIPAELPTRIAVMPMEGDVKMTGLVGNLVEDQLYLYGFDVVDYKLVEESLCQHKILPCDVIKRENRAFLTDELGLDGLVAGEVSTRTQLSRIVAGVKLELIRIDTGQVLWMGSVENQKWSVKSAKQRKCVTRSVKKLLNRLSKDMKKYERIKMKRMKKEQME